MKQFFIKESEIATIRESLEKLNQARGLFSQVIIDQVNDQQQVASVSNLQKASDELHSNVLSILDKLPEVE